MNIYLVLINSSEFSQEITIKLRTFSDFYFITDKICLVKSNKDSSQQVFDEIVGENKSKNIIVFLVSNDPPKDYWGFGPRDLWEWLKTDN